MKFEFEIWMKLLNKVPNSVLWLYKSNKYAEENIKCLRPNIGLPPKYFKHILKLRSPSELNYGDPITNKLYKKIKTYNK